MQSSPIFFSSFTLFSCDGTYNYSDDEDSLGVDTCCLYDEYYEDTVVTYEDDEYYEDTVVTYEDDEFEEEDDSFSETEGLLYTGTYREEGQGRSSTGKYLNTIPCCLNVQIFEDYLSVNGIDFSLSRINGNTRIYNGLGVTGLNETYCLDGDFNIRHYVEFRGVMGMSDWFEFTVTKMDGGSHRHETHYNNKSYESNNEERTPRKDACLACKRTGNCGSCNGTGKKISEMSLVSDNTVYMNCRNCRGTGICPACKGDGWLNEGVDF